MSLKLVSLASGSKGNATLILSNSTAILVDAGVSYSRISSELSDFGLKPSDIDGVVVTHEHSDHIKSASTLLKQLPQMELFANSETLEAANLEIPGEKVQLVKSNRAFKIGDIMVTALPVSHYL